MIKINKLNAAMSCTFLLVEPGSLTGVHYYQSCSVAVGFVDYRWTTMMLIIKVIGVMEVAKLVLEVCSPSSFLTATSSCSDSEVGNQAAGDFSTAPS